MEGGLGKTVKEKVGEMAFFATYLGHDVSELYRQTERETDGNRDLTLTLSR